MRSSIPTFFHQKIERSDDLIKGACLGEPIRAQPSANGRTAGPFLRPGRRWESAITTEAGRVADAIVPVLVVRSYGRERAQRSRHNV